MYVHIHVCTLCSCSTAFVTHVVERRYEVRWGAKKEVRMHSCMRMRARVCTCAC